MPSVFESFGMSAAEAMLHAVPVLVTDRTGIAEVIGRRGGGVVSEPDPASVAAKVLELDRARDSLSAIGAAGQAAVLAELHADAIGPKLRDAYTEALELGPRKGRPR